MSFLPLGRYNDMNQSLTDKHAVIYGAAGGIGTGAARAFAREGAHLHLVGHTEQPLRRLAGELGEAADMAVLDAFDEVAVSRHLAGCLAWTSRSTW